MFKQTSKKAFKRIPAIDFIHFDGNFSEESCLEDLTLYLPKVKKGGHVLLSNYIMEVNGSDFKFRVLSFLCHEHHINFLPRKTRPGKRASRGS